MSERSAESKKPESRMSIAEQETVSKEASPTVEVASDTSHDKAEPRRENKSSVVVGARQWKPFFLHRPVLFSFALFGVAFLTVLEVLRAQSARNTGFAHARPALHYLWTFAPTAVLTIVTACWNQVDYQTRQNAPWLSLLRKKVPAGHNVLLDYLSPWDFQVLMGSVGQGHYEVTLTTLCSLVLRVLIVLSTGLLALRYPSRTSDVPITFHDQLDTSAWRSRSFIPSSISVSGFEDTSSTQSPATALSPIAEDAMLPALFNVSYVDGTNAQYATQSFSTQDTTAARNATYTATAQAVSVDLQCEKAEWTYADPNAPMPKAATGAYAKLNFTSQTYLVTEMLFSSIGQDIFGTGYEASPEAITSVADTGWIIPVSLRNTTCRSRTSAQDRDCFVTAFGYSLDDTDYFGGRQFTRNAASRTATATAGDFAPIASATPTRSAIVGRQVAFHDGKPIEQIIRIAGMTALLCVPTINFANVHVSTSSTDISTNSGIADIKVIDRIPEASLGISAFDVAFQVSEAIRRNSTVPAARVDGLLGMGDLLVPGANITKFYDPQVLEEATRSAFQRASALWAKRNLMRPQQASGAGTMVAIEPRLFVETLSLRLVDGFLAIFIVSAMALCLFFPFPGLPRDFSSIGAMAMVFARSPHFMRLLSSLGASRLKVLKFWLRGYLFSISTNTIREEGAFRIAAEIDEAQSEEDVEGRPPETRLDYWRPLIFGKGYRITTVLLPLLLVAGLEAAYRWSSRHDGFGEVPSDGYLRYLWLYFPALIMVGSASLFSVLDFSTRTFQPFQPLRSSRRGQAQGLFDSSFGELALVSAFKGLTKGQWALLATSVAACLSPILTVAVSGLFIPTPIIGTLPVNVNITSTFESDTSVRPKYEPSSVDNVGDMIFSRNMSWPRFTYQNLVFPEFNLTPYQSEGNKTEIWNATRSSKIRVAVPALRVRSNCSSLESALPTRESPLVLGCDFKTVVKFYELGIPFARGPWQGSAEAWEPSSLQTNLTCASHVSRVTPGYTLQRNISGTVDPSLLIQCFPTVQLIVVNAIFDSPQLAVDPSQPVSEIEGIARLWDLHLNMYDMGRVDLLGGKYKRSEALLNSLIGGNYGVPEDRLLAPGGDKLLADALTRQFDIIFAQRISVLLRRPVTAENGTGLFMNPSTVLDATVVDYQRLRVVQSEVSTRVLQALFSVLSFCALVAWAFTKSNKVLPKNPLSIAAVASLLADSDLLNEHFVPPGSEFMSNKELRKRGILEGLFFSIGWWGTGLRKRYGIDIGEAEKPG